MNVASWNVRGLNISSHQKELMYFISSNKISLMSCIETKVKVDMAAKISQIINKSLKMAF